MISPELLEVLACPCCDDRPALQLAGDDLLCSQCNRRYPIVDGIPQLLPESAIEDGRTQESKI